MAPAWSYFVIHQAGGITLANSQQLHGTVNLPQRVWGSQHIKKTGQCGIILVNLLPVTDLLILKCTYLFHLPHTFTYSHIY